MGTFGTNPALSLFAISAAVVGLHLLALAFWTATVRVMRKAFVNPEDARLNKGTEVDVDHPDVQRAKRAHLNALENAVPFFVIGYLFVLTSPSELGAGVYFFTFAAARVLHSIFYLAGRQPFRTMTFAIGALATMGMGVQVLVATV
jgi:glutathione S-transferase